jgi:transposase
MESKAKIRRLYFIKEYSINQIMRECHVSRNTVRTIIRSDDISSNYQRKNQFKPKLGKFKNLLDDWLESDHKLARKQRRNAMRYYTQLSEEQGYDGAYDSVQRYVKDWRQTHKEKLDAFIPLVFAPGEAYQFDWSDEIVQLGGIDYRLKVAQFKLCYSRKFIVIAYFRETQDMLFDAHNRAFVFFGGQTLRGIYDNMKTAVDSVFLGKERNFNRRFLSLMDHYLIEPTACNPAAGWEKGRIERQVDNIRNWLFLPKLKFNNIDELNQHLEQKCIELAEQRKHTEIKDKTIQEMYEVEKSHLKILTNPYDGYGETACKVSSTSLVTFDRNRYSVECAYANKAVSVKSYANRIEIVCNAQVIGSHHRYFGRDKTAFDPFHYLPLLERKPGALRNGAPFERWDLPVSIREVKEILLKRKGGDKECAEVLCAMSEHGVDAVQVACELALEDKVVTRDYILNALNRLRPSAKPQTIKTPDTLKLKVEPLANCQQYNQLLVGTSNVIH